MTLSPSGSRFLSGLSEVAVDYDLFLVDQWGVLHDGINGHPGAVEALEQLRALGKRIIILSNSGKRRGDSVGRLERIGVRRELYDHIVTSGDTVHQCFMDRTDPFYRALGRRFLIFTWQEDSRTVVEGADVEEVDQVEDADFLLCTGTDQGDLAYYRPILAKALERDLPLICANPDFTSVGPDGTHHMCPGMVAKTYEDMGGRVRWHGKPFREIYETCRALAPGCDRILGIGDSLDHDIKGASDFGADSLFICGGIHARDLQSLSPPDESGLARLFNGYGVTPTYASARFAW